jgi:acetate kinase
MKQLSFNPDQMAGLLSTKAGLAGISGCSGDVRDLMESASNGDDRSRLAMDVYVRSVRNYIAQFFVALGGLDVLSFTGGIGENSVEMRNRICDGLDILGIELDSAANALASGEACIEKQNSSVRILVVPADEERVVARATVEILSGSVPPSASSTGNGRCKN